MSEGVSGRVRARAPGKVNLFLGVGGARDDGFHELRTVFQSVDLWETVTLTAADVDSVTVTAADPVADRGDGITDVPTDASNLAMRAVDLLRAEAGCLQPVEVRVEKRIPVAGGMAGGSADAAAALLAANELLGLRLGRGELEERAAGLGSDVPFCLRGGTVIGTGRGENLVPLLGGGPTLHHVIVTAGGGLATPEVFAELDRLREAGNPAPAGDLEHVTRALAAGDEAAFAAATGNDLQAAALALRPALHATLRAIGRTAPLVSMVSGSGPTCFGAYPDRTAALDAAAELAETGVARDLFVTHGPAGGARIEPETPRHDRN